MAKLHRLDNQTSIREDETFMERNKDLIDEKEKTEKLLYQMLPVPAAAMLKENKPVTPEPFENCTIYFSDICGFTTISLHSNAMQVVKFLDDFYSCFDKITANYDVYKVETIGDAYMVSSGVPMRIGDRHASEIARLSLDLLSATCTLKVRHLPNVTLRIRIGLHSGSCVGGVVGKTMPRYCLFGDTINTASRLESTGIPSRIHMSTKTRDHLVKSNMGFKIEKRGDIELKGRGVLTTWWLTGKDGWEKPLPIPGDVNSLNHGIDPRELPKIPPNEIGKKQASDGSTNNKNVNGNNNHYFHSYSGRAIKKIINSKKLKLFGAKKTNEVRPLV